MSEILELSKYEELIYNTHLRISKIHLKQPFKYRKNFKTLDDKTVGTLKKISYFLRKFDHIKLDDFISAPYTVYKDENYFDLEYYTTLKATKAFALFQNIKLTEDPDSAYHLNNIVESLNFIQKFCKEQNITLPEYTSYCTGKVPDFITHLKEHKVNIYTLIPIHLFEKQIKILDPELVKFILGEEMYNKIPLLKTKLYGSQKAYKLTKAGLQIIEKKLQKKD